jgi:uncharacterized membrane protein YozB (DUF420 family)
LAANLNFDIHQLPTVNAVLNASAAVLLVVGWVLIKQRRERAHKIVMLSAFGVSVVFLVSYLIYHFQVRHVPFAGPDGIRPLYFAVLITHVVLAATVPVLAGVTIYLGYRDLRPKHRAWARWTFPIWLYVSVTGVIIYLMLYQLFPASDKNSTIEATAGAPVAVESAGP